jgi:hypothetical protein
MFELPSLWNFIASSLAFFIAALYIGRYMDGRKIPEGRTRGILIFALASAVSWGAGEVADKMAGTPPAAHSDLSQMIKAISGPQS